MQRKTTDGPGWTQSGSRRRHGIWSAAGSEAPRRFGKQAAPRKAVSPLRSVSSLPSATARVIVVLAIDGTVAIDPLGPGIGESFLHGFDVR